MLAVELSLAITPIALAQQVTIERCQPASIRAGQTTEITLAGRGLENVSLWSSFPAEIECVDAKAKRFRIKTDFAGAGALRAHTNDGVSNLFFIQSEAKDHIVIPCEKRTNLKTAQELSLPALIEGSTLPQGSSFYRFTAKQGKPVVIHARGRGSGFDGVLILRDASSGRRLAFADDSAVDGADPLIVFLPPADASFVVELMDSQYRGNLAFQLRLGPENATTAPLVTEDDPANPVPIQMEETITARFESKGDEDAFLFSIPQRSFVTITPGARSLRSPATPHLKLTNAAGKTLVETPHDAFDERRMHLWIDKGEEYLLTFSEAFNRYGSEYLYSVSLSIKEPPFELGIPHQADKKHPLQDKFVAVPGGVFVVPVQIVRHQFDAPITLRTEPEKTGIVENPVIEAKKGNANFRVRVAEGLQPGDLAHFRVEGAAFESDRPLNSSLRTLPALKGRHKGEPVPACVDGQLAVRIVECPLEVTVSPPARVARGERAIIPVKLVWRDDKRKFNTTLRIVGAPDGVQTSEKKLNNKDTTTGLEVMPRKDWKAGETLKHLRVEVTVDYFKQSLLVASKPFAIEIGDQPENEKPQK